MKHRYKRTRWEQLPDPVKEEFLLQFTQKRCSRPNGWWQCVLDRTKYIMNRRDEWYIALLPN